MPETINNIDPDIPGTAYVLFSEKAAKDVENGDFNAGRAGIGITSVERIIPDGGEFDARHREAGLHRWYKVEFSKVVTATKASESLEEMSEICAVSFPMKKASCSSNHFNDELFKYQWNLFNDGSLQSTSIKNYYVSGCDANVLKVWKEYTAGSKDVIVAVLDGAPDMTDKDFKDVVIPQGPHGSRCFVNGYEGEKTYFQMHGANVSGIIGAVNNNGYGLASVAGGDDGTGGVRILSCQIALENPRNPNVDIFAGDDNIMKAFVHAADEGAVICNNSWGYVYDTEEQAIAGAKKFIENDSPLKSGIDYFINNAGYDKDGNQTGPMAGGLVVFAADNSAFSMAVPSSYDKVMAVAAHGAHFNFASYSSYGSWVDLIAPGGDNDDVGDTNLPFGMILGPFVENEGVDASAGTSQAAPHVSGVAALLVSFFGGPGLTNSMVWDYLVGGAKENVLTGKMTGPVLDAYGSFEYALNKDKSIHIITEYDGDYHFKSHEYASVTYRILGNESKKLDVTLETDCKAVTFNSTTTQLVMNVNALLAEPGTYYVKIFVGKGTKDEVKEEFELVILPNHAPEVFSKIGELVLDANGGNFNLDMSQLFIDPDGEELTYEIKSGNDKIVAVNQSDRQATVSAKDYGTVDITITAKDARGASASQTFKAVARNKSRSYDIYPNPVHDYLYVRAGSDAQTSVELFNASGATVLSTAGKSSPSSPLKLDVSGLATGEYVARITIAGKTDDVPVVKY